MFVSLLKRGIFQKERICSPWGANYFLLEYTPFQKGLGVHDSKQEVAKIVSLVKRRKIYQVYLSPLNTELQVVITSDFSNLHRQNILMSTFCMVQLMV